MNSYHFHIIAIDGLERSENAQLTLSLYDPSTYNLGVNGFQLTSSLLPPTQVFSTHNQTDSFTFEWTNLRLNRTIYESLFYHVHVSNPECAGTSCVDSICKVCKEYYTYKPYFTATELNANQPYVVEVSTLALGLDSKWKKSRTLTRINTRTLSPRYGLQHPIRI